MGRTQNPDDSAPGDSPAPSPADAAEPVTLVVKNPPGTDFLWHTTELVTVDDTKPPIETEIPYRITPYGTEVPAELAVIIMDSALSAGVLVTAKD